MGPGGLRHLYVHVPFCVRRCGYCSFYSTTAADHGLLERYVAAVLRELEPAGAGPLETLYVGGGTPSLLGPDRVAALLAGIRDRATLCPGAEVTLEANPESLGPGMPATLRDAGVTRLSLGVQSFDDGDLRVLGRPHDAAAARAAVDAALEAGLRVSLDLIYGLPGRDAAHWRRQLDAAAAAGVEHLSAYELTLEPGTPLWERHLRPESTESLFFLTHSHLEALGFEGYEVSSFARAPAARSRHNAATWEGLPYLGLGPAAHSFLEDAAGPLRRWNLPDLEGWIGALEAGIVPPRGEERPTPSQRLLERLMLGLRTREGVDLTAARSELGDAAVEAVLARAAGPAATGLLRHRSGRLRPTLRGLAVADRLALDLA